MRWVKEDEAKERFPELLEEVAQGETVVVLRGGLKIAKIVPDEESKLLYESEEDKARRRKAVAEFLEWRRARKPRGITLEEALEWRHASE